MTLGAWTNCPSAFNVTPMDDAPALLDSSPDPDIEIETEASDYRTLSNGHLTPRHRRLAQLAAEGLSNQKIGEVLGYVGSRVSILLKNPYIADEIRRLQERIFEETVQTRLKSFAEPALNNIHMILTDRTNRVKISEKADMSKWVLEMQIGKATQKTDLGENTLALFMDKLDARKSQPPREVGGSGESSPADIETKALPEAPKEKDLLTEWVESFCRDGDGM